MSETRIEITGNIVVHHPVKEDHWDKALILIGGKEAVEQERIEDLRRRWIDFDEQAA